MAGVVTMDVDVKPLMAKLKELQPVFKKNMRDLVKRAAKNFVKNVVKLTPPGGVRGRWESNPGQIIDKGLEAKKRGIAAINTDLFGGRRGSGPKPGKRAGIFTVMSKGALAAKARQFSAVGSYTNKAGEEKLWVSKDGRVYGVQATLYRPNATLGEMLAHHNEYFKNGAMSSAGGYTRDIGRWRFIDKMVITKGARGQIVEALSDRVGFFAGGWNAAAKSLGLNLPKWISRHNSPGNAYQVDNRNGFSITMTNSVSYRQALQVDRIIQSTLGYVMEGFIRDAAKRKEHSVKEAGFTK